MDNQITIFENEMLGAVRTLYQNGEPWFVGKDVADMLGYKETAKAIREHVDEDDKGVSVLDTPGGKQEAVIINEAGVYSLIFSSKLPAAKAFKRWVTHEVLPSIRRHGAYLSDEVLERVSKEPEYLIQVAEEIKTAKRTHEGMCAGNLRKQLADYGKKIKQRDLIDILANGGYILMIKATKYTPASLLPSEKYIENGWFAPFENTDEHGFSAKGFCLTDEGKAAIANLFVSE
jgi:prophage antirepressor-like protein